MGRLITTIRDSYPVSDDQLVAVSAAPSAAASVPAQQGLVLPWTGILFGVLLVIGVIAALRLVDRIGTNIIRANDTATAIVVTQHAAATASASPFAQTATPESEGQGIASATPTP